ncbi:SRPBCC family protein [Aeromicrobium sp.]|uniref:SRPBCC family protein n=1 Tax=Aeromicrobium sp. TaxID=1871063 RepID=UPI003C30ECEF
MITATPDEVWDVLADGWLYPLWVVGATRIRDVDEDWPAKGSRIHHSVGVWPVMIDDHTRVLAAVPGRSITLRARAWPMGEADVVIRLEDVGVQTEVTIEEEVVAGPGKAIPAPITGLSLKWRNVETLRRLAFVVEGRRGTSHT